MSTGTAENPLPYRPCVGIMLINAEGLIFVGERLDNPGAWQMPQGGIDDGEDVEDAFFRELREEIGTDDADILRIYDKKLRYDLPRHLMGKLWGGKWGGQEQTWVAARFMGSDSDINIAANRHQEFKAWKWVKAEKALELAVPFKRETYGEVIRAFGDLIS